MPKKKKRVFETLTLRREGEFTLHTYGDNHCGVESPNQKIRYYFEAVCTTKLDKRGFLFDQLTVDAFFKKQTHTSKSCERLVILYSKLLRRLIKKENPECEILETRLELKASPYLASMTCHWIAGGGAEA
jgi:hypothetical protein